MTWQGVAPGKIVLLGEYAVVDGAPALVMAVDSGVACRWGPGEALLIEAPDDRFVRPALEAAEAPPGRYHFFAHRPMPTQTKPGLGSSAAATVVAIRAGLEARGELPSPETVHALAKAVHQRVQGSGSGVDVAASAHGGMLRFTQDEVRAICAPVPLVIWSGRSASTGARVERYLRWTGRAAFCEESAALIEAYPSAPIETLREAIRLLDAMARQAALPYWTDGLRQITRLAERYGGAAKPSGAGGGDCAIALLPDPPAEAAFREACEAAGFPVLPLSVAPGAARVHGLESPP